MFFLKKIFCILLVYSGICRLFYFIHRNSVKILVYHGLISENLPAGLNREGLHLKLICFEKHIAYLRKHYHIMALSEFLEYLKEGRPFPRYSVVLTFDDGYKNNYDNLKDIVRKFKIPASVFLTTDYIGTSELLWLDRLEMAFFNSRKKSITFTQSIGVSSIKWGSEREKMRKFTALKNYLKKLPPDKLKEALNNLFLELTGDEVAGCDKADDIPYTRLLNWNEVKELSQYGVLFGSHTCGHEILTVLSDLQIRDTLKRSFAAVSEHTGGGGIPFAYPNGSFNDEVKKSVAKAGYNCALTTVHGFNSKAADLYALKRNEIGNRGDIHIFIATLSGILDFIKSYTRLSKRFACIY